MGQQFEQQFLALAPEERAGLVEVAPGGGGEVAAATEALGQQPTGSSAERNLGICVVQARADVDALLDDREVLVKR